MNKQIESFEAACAALSMASALPEVSHLPERYQKKIIADYKLDVIIEAQNESHVFDYNDYSEDKFFPIWDMETYGDAPAGSGFALFVVDREIAFTRVGSRRVFCTEEDCRYICEQHKELYRDSLR